MHRPTEQLHQPAQALLRVVLQQRGRGGVIVVQQGGSSLQKWVPTQNNAGNSRCVSKTIFDCCAIKKLILMAAGRDGLQNRKTSLRLFFISVKRSKYFRRCSV
jgi:hypothetical protein